MRLRVPIVTSALILAMAACGKPAPVANDLKPMNGTVLANAAAPEPDPEAAPPKTAEASATAAPEATAPGRIPASLQGRWGLSPGDCVGPLNSAKGLLVINSGELRFYESRAVPSPDVQTDAGATRGQFHFTGEGQTWDKFESLKRNGDKLTRTEGEPTASYTYAKC